MCVGIKWTEYSKKTLYQGQIYAGISCYGQILQIIVALTRGKLQASGICRRILSGVISTSYKIHIYIKECQRC